MRTKRTHRVICEALEYRRLLSSTPNPVINFYNTNITVDHPSPTEDQALNNDGSTPIEWMENIPLHVTAIAAGEQSGTSLNDTTDPDNAEIKAEYQWNFDSTGVDPTGEYDALTGFNAAHIYTTPGTYYLTFTVTNEDGYSSGPKTVEVDIGVGSDPTTTHVFYVASTSGGRDDGSDKDDAMDLATLQGRLATGSSNPIPSDSQILFKNGDEFDLSSGLSISQSNILISNYCVEGGSTDLPILNNTATTGYPVILYTSGTNIVVSNINFTSSGGHVFALFPQGDNLCVLDCKFSSFSGDSDFVDGEVPATDGLMLEGNSLNDTTTSDLAYFLFTNEMNDIVVLGNSVDGNTGGPDGIIRVTTDAASTSFPERILIADNPKLTNEDGTDIRLLVGGYGYVVGNTLSATSEAGNTIIVGAENGGLSSGIFENTIIENNNSTGGVILAPGFSGVVIRNNLFIQNEFGSESLAAMIRISGKPTEFTSTDVYVLNNTEINSRDDGAFIFLANDVPNISVINNLYVETGSSVFRADSTQGGVITTDSDLSDFTAITGNIWPSLSGGSDPDAAEVGGLYIGEVEWVAEYSDTFAAVGLVDPSGTPQDFIPTSDIGTASPVDGVSTDFYGKPRPASDWTAGAVEPDLDIASMGYVYLQANGSDIQVWNNNTGAGPGDMLPDLSLPFSSFEDFDIEGQSDAPDELTLNYSYGDLANQGLTFNGNGTGGGTNNDFVNVLSFGLDGDFAIIDNTLGFVTGGPPTTQECIFNGVTLFHFVSGTDGTLELDPNNPAALGNMAVFVDGGDLTIGESVAATSGQPELSLDLLDVASSAKATLASGQDSILTLNSLDLGSGGGDYGTLDLSDNEMILESGSESAIQAYLNSGFDSGGWDGTGIVTSATDTGKTLGYATGDELGNTFDGSSIDSDAVVVKYTWLGDTNLDGILTSIDLDNFTTGADWFTGDSNYDGVINADDYLLLSTGAEYYHDYLSSHSIVSGVSFGPGESSPLWDAVEAGSESTFNSEHPTWDYDNADFNQDGVINSDDLEAFSGISAYYNSPAILSDINPGSSGSSPENLTAVGNTLFFTANDSVHGTQLWKTDGTLGGTVMITDTGGGINATYFTDFNGILVFAESNGMGGCDLWKSDGTSAGTEMISDVSVDVYNTSFTPIGDELYFFAYDGTHGEELWKTDGTSGGTMMVKDINPGSASSVSNPEGSIVAFNGDAYFWVNDGTHGTELWKSDGTADGTTMVDDINPGSGSSVSSNPWALAVVGDTLFFAANDGTDGTELWKTDGTAGGTSMIELSSDSNPMDFTNLNGLLIFTAYNGFGFQLWRSDGTATGTYLLSSSIIEAENFCVVDDTLYFVAMGSGSYGLYKTDGTTAGTQFIVVPGNITPYWLVNVNSTLYFQSGNGTYGAELWTSDGTSAGTIMVADIRAGSSSSNPSYLTAVGNTLYFIANDGIDGAELWMLN